MAVNNINSSGKYLRLCVLGVILSLLVITAGLLMIDTSAAFIKEPEDSGQKSTITSSIVSDLPEHAYYINSQTNNRSIDPQYINTQFAQFNTNDQIATLEVNESENDEEPTAEFDINPEEQVPDKEVTIDASASEAPSGEIVEYDWKYEYESSAYGNILNSTESGESFSNSWDSAGEYRITLEVTDNGGKVDEITRTIVVGDVPSFSVESLSAANTRIVTGEFVEITATITNNGDAAGETVLSLSQDGEQVRSADTSLQVGETDTISFDVTVPTTPSEVTYDLDTGDDTGTVTVTAVSEDELDDAEYQVNIAELSSPTAGDDLRVVVEVENVGELPGEQLIEVAADGLGVTSKSISLGGGERTQEEFSIGTESSGTYDLEVSSNSDTAKTDATVLAPSEIVISEFNIADIEQDPVVSATVSNLGDVEGEQTIELTADGETVESKRISVQPGGEPVVEFDPDVEDLPEGEAEFGLATDDDSETERATVVSPSEIVISEFSVTDVEEGPTVIATLSNRGDVADDQTVDLTADGDVVAQERVNVQPGQETVVEFTPDTADLPEGDVEFGVTTSDDSATEVTSLPESDSDTSENTPSSTDGETTTTAESDSNTPSSSGNDGGIIETIPGGNMTLISVFLLLSLLSVGGYLASAGSGSSTETDHSVTAASTEKNAANQATEAPPDDDSATSDSRILDLPEDFSVEYDDIERGELIGSGGFADVYTGKLAIGQTEATVAVKEPRVSGTIEVSQGNQLIEEAKRWSRLDDHDHIVRVIDYGGRPLPWIIMEYMEAGSLDTVADEMSFEEKLQAAVEVTDAVNHAHQKGVAHLDIKPENILFTESGPGRPVAKVADWGLSKHLLDQSKSREGMTVEYAAPEQFDPEQSSDNFTDIYQLGAVFYELFTGRSPFSGEVFAVMEQIKNEDPDLPSNIADVPKELDEILLTAMSKDPDDRYESVLYLRDNLQKITRDR